MIDFTFRNSTGEHGYARGFFLNILTVSIRELGISRSFGISVTLTSEDQMRQLNKQYRGKDKTTDVLSFPLAEGIFNTLISASSVDRDILELGDIFICRAVAEQKAREAGHTLDYEMAFLTVHGFLHLLGFDHERSAAAEREMFGFQDAILAQLNIQN